MPTYDRQCVSCQHEFEDFCRVDQRDHDVPCEKCTCATMRVWRPGSIRKTGIFPYETTHLDGKGTKIVVESLTHLRALERQHGVKATAFSDNTSNWDYAGSARGDELPRSRS